MFYYRFQFAFLLTVTTALQTLTTHGSNNPALATLQVPGKGWDPRQEGRKSPHYLTSVVCTPCQKHQTPEELGWVALPAPTQISRAQHLVQPQLSEDFSLRTAPSAVPGAPSHKQHSQQPLSGSTCPSKLTSAKILSAAWHQWPPGVSSEQKSPLGGVQWWLP